MVCYCCSSSSSGYRVLCVQRLLGCFVLDVSGFSSHGGDRVDLSSCRLPLSCSHSARSPLSSLTVSKLPLDDLHVVLYLSDLHFRLLLMMILIPITFPDHQRSSD